MSQKPDQPSSVPWWYKLSWLLSDWLQKVLIGVGWLLLLLVRPGRALGVFMSENRSQQALESEDEDQEEVG